MRKRWALVAGLGLLLSCAWGTRAIAQDDPVPAVPDDDEQTAAAPADDAEAPAVPAAVPPPEEKKKFHIGLYASVGIGQGDANSFDSSISTDSTRYSRNSFTISDQTLGMFSIGWQLPEGNGDFRLNYTGFDENEFTYNAIGATASVWGTETIDGALGGQPLNPGCTFEELTKAFEKGQLPASALDNSPGFLVSPLGGACLYAWWNVNINGGQYVAARTPGQWGLDDDDNENGAADPGEVRFGRDTDPLQIATLPSGADRMVIATTPDSMQNQIVTWDAVYGREFGGRRFSSRWWAGARYFQYEGQVLANAWLNPQGAAPTATGFTDQSFLPLINISQKTTGWGPVGTWEAHFNFFNKGLVFYLRGTAAYTFNSLHAKSNTFFSVLELVGDRVVLAPVQLDAQRDKSTWQTAGGLGVQINLRNGFDFELGWERRGYLDTVLLPNTINIPTLAGQIEPNDPVATISALYSSQDIVIDAWHAKVGFQF
jgi:hypothetical protein